MSADDAPPGPVRRLVGLVGPSGAAGGSSGGADWDLIVRFVAWRYVDDGMPDDPHAAIRTEPVRCLLPMPRSDISEWMARLRPYGTVELEAADGAAEAGLVTGGRIVAVDSPDAALLRHAARLQEPVTLDHPVFGALTYDRRYDWYEATADWRGAAVSLYLETGTPDADAPATRATLAHAEALFADPAGWGARIDGYAVERLLALKNDSWSDEDDDGTEGPPVTPEAFVARMTLESIQLGPQGEFTFMHDDGELFFGHAIQVTGTLAEGPTDADIPG